MIRVLTVLVALAVFVPTANSVPTAAAPSDASRAQMSFDALQRAFGTSDGSGLYRESYPAAKTPHRYSYEWPFSQVHVAVLDLTGLPGRVGASYNRVLAEVDAAQRHYWARTAPGGRPGFLSSALPPYDKGGTLFYDDNEWVGLEAMQDYAQHHHSRALRLAEKVFDLAVSGWDHDGSHARRGGVYWMQAHRNNDRNTVSNMPAAELGLRLYQVTGRQSYLSWATKMYRWANRNLQRADGLFYDHVDLKGHVDRSLWSYNQGVSIAVNLVLYRITNHRSYLHRAERIASAAYQYFVASGRLDGQPVAFNSILFKHMLALESLTGGTRYRAATQAYADKMWDRWRDPKTGVYHFKGDKRTDVIEQAAATQICAMLAWPRNALSKVA